LALFLPLAIASSANAQGEFMTDVHRAAGDVQTKIINLANAIPESAYGWRPTGARSVGEVLLHVAADNYLIPIMWDKPAPAATGISMADMKSAETYEMRKLSKAQIVAELEASFTHLHNSLGTSDANLSENIKFFGTDMSRRRTLIGTLNHLHEHLGQLIAYARSNNVKPPWSR